MLNKKLIAIAIVTLGLVMTVSTFGQDRGKRPDRKNPDIKRSDAIIKPMYVANQEEYMAGAIADVRGGAHDRGEETARTNKKTTNQSQSKLGNFEIQDLIVTPKQIQAGQNSGGTISNQRTKQNSQDKLGNFEIQDIKSPRDVATGQVMNKNCQEFESVRSKKSSNIQSPRDVASGQATGIKSNSETTAQYNPKEIGIDKVSRKKNLGDTGTHEVGHKQRKRGNN